MEKLDVLLSFTDIGMASILYRRMTEELDKSTDEEKKDIREAMEYLDDFATGTWSDSWIARAYF